MELDPQDFDQVDPLTLSNAVTISALVGLLIRKGLVSDAELVREIRALRSRLTGQPAAGEDD